MSTDAKGTLRLDRSGRFPTALTCFRNNFGATSTLLYLCMDSQDGHQMKVECLATIGVTFQTRRSAKISTSIKQTSTRWEACMTGHVNCINSLLVFTISASFIVLTRTITVKNWPVRYMVRSILKAITRDFKLSISHDIYAKLSKIWTKYMPFLRAFQVVGTANAKFISSAIV